MKAILHSTLLIIALFSAHPSFSQHTHTHADGTVHADHGAEEAEEMHSDAAPESFTVESASARYELLLRYEHIHPGEETHLTLFVSDFNTNAPLDSVSMQILSADDANVLLEPEKEGEGTWHIHATFPEKKIYSLTVTLGSGATQEQLVLHGIEVGKEPEATAHAHTHWYASRWFLVMISALGGILLFSLFQKLTRNKVGRSTLSIFLILVFIPSGTTMVNAHDEHEEAAKTSFGNEFTVPKETQFLLDMFTQNLQPGGEVITQTFFGTVIPSSGGEAVLSSPQNGKIVSINTTVGSSVKAGQTLAVIEGFITAPDALALKAEANSLQAEYDAAKKQYERLQSIADIAAKKDIDEAKARYDRATSNLELYRNKVSTRIELKSPINGVIDNFTLAIGATVGENQTLFTIVNPSLVYIDAQVYGNADAMILSAGKFIVTTSSEKESPARLLAMPQTLHPGNQSQHVLFEVDNAGSALKLGEYVSVRALSTTNDSALVVPAGAITEIDGKSAVFVKEAAEQYELRFVNLENSNGTTVHITKGLEAGERIITNATYQMKMIYLNQ